MKREPPSDRTAASFISEVANRERPRNRPSAAVVEDQEAPVPRVVPLGSKSVKLGSATLGYMHKPTRTKGTWSRNVQRLAEVEMLVVWRRKMSAEHGVVYDIAPEAYLRAVMAELLAETHRPRSPTHRATASAWAREFLPDLAKHSLEWFEALAAEFQNRRPLRADSIAMLLGVTWEERKALGIRTIGAIDMNKRQRKAERRRAHAEREKRRRVAGGAKPRAASLMAAEPWKEIGISRAAWYRLKRTSETDSCASSNADSETDSCATEIARETDSCAVYPYRGESTYSSQASRTEHFSRRELDTTTSHYAMNYAMPSQPKDTIQFSLLDPVQDTDDLRMACDAWTAGPMPSAVRQGYVDAKRRRALRQEDVAEAISISRPQLANALTGTFNLSPEAIERFKRWLLQEGKPSGGERIAA